MPKVIAPTLLIVGGLDAPVMQMNRDAMAQMRNERVLEIVPCATHLFEEPGTLERIAELSGGLVHAISATHALDPGALRLR